MGGERCQKMPVIHISALGAAGETIFGGASTTHLQPQKTKKQLEGASYTGFWDYFFSEKTKKKNGQI